MTTIHERLLELSHAPAWAQDAACAGHDPELWFASSVSARREAQQICAGCPVRQSCADQALKDGESHGVWGGIDTEETHRLARRNPATGTVKKCAECPNMVRPNGALRERFPGTVALHALGMCSGCYKARSRARKAEA